MWYFGPHLRYPDVTDRLINAESYEFYSSFSLFWIYFMDLGYTSLNDICGVNLSIGITYKRVIPRSYAAC